MVPWNLVEHRSEWIFQPKTDVLALLSRVCRLPPAAARHLIEEHQAVVLAVNGASPEGRRFMDANRSDSRAGGWALLDELAERGLVYTVPDRDFNWWRPTPQSLLSLGLRTYTEIPEFKELERWLEA